MNWILKPWSALTTDELYELLALRAEVFVVEQSCPFQDLDGGGAVFFRFGLDRGVLWILGHGLLSQKTMYSDCTIPEAGVRRSGDLHFTSLRIA